MGDDTIETRYLDLNLTACVDSSRDIPTWSNIAILYSTSHIDIGLLIPSQITASISTSTSTSTSFHCLPAIVGCC